MFYLFVVLSAAYQLLGIIFAEISFGLAYFSKVARWKDLELVCLLAFLQARKLLYL